MQEGKYASVHEHIYAGHADDEVTSAADVFTHSSLKLPRLKYLPIALLKSNTVKHLFILHKTFTLRHR